MYSGLVIVVVVVVVSPGMPGCQTGNSNTFVTYLNRKQSSKGCWKKTMWFLKDPSRDVILVISFLKTDTMKGMGLGIMLLFPKVQLPLSDETEFMFKVIETSLTILQICRMPDKLFSIYLKERDQMMKTMENLFDIFKCSYSTEYIKTDSCNCSSIDSPVFTKDILIFQAFFPTISTVSNSFMTSLGPSGSRRLHCTRKSTGTLLGRPRSHPVFPAESGWRVEPHRFIKSNKDTGLYGYHIVIIWLHMVIIRKHIQMFHELHAHETPI